MFIPVLGQKYRVRFGKPLSGAVAHADPTKQEIVLHKELRKNKAHMRRVLLHEIGHAYCYESGMADYMNDREQEMFAQTFANLCDGLFDLKRSFASIL